MNSQLVSLPKFRVYSQQLLDGVELFGLFFSLGPAGLRSFGLTIGSRNGMSVNSMSESIEERTTNGRTRYTLLPGLSPETVAWARAGSREGNFRHTQPQQLCTRQLLLCQRHKTYDRDTTTGHLQTSLQKESSLLC